jgi:hypothetical protein
VSAADRPLPPRHLRAARQAATRIILDGIASVADVDLAVLARQLGREAAALDLDPLARAAAATTGLREVAAVADELAHLVAVVTGALDQDWLSRERDLGETVPCRDCPTGTRLHPGDVAAHQRDVHGAHTLFDDAGGGGG